MPSIRPFKGIIYNKRKVKDIAKVDAPPDDVIPPKMQGKLYRKHRNNVIRLILGKIGEDDNENNNRYTRAAKTFESWLKEKILVQDGDPAIYIYSQTYKYDNRTIERIGFISLMKLDLTSEMRRARFASRNLSKFRVGFMRGLNVPYASRNKVLPHENTLKAPKEDRLNLMRSVKANLSPIFMLYEDDRDEISGILKKVTVRTKPFIDIDIDSVRNRAWKLTGKKAIEKIEKFMGGKNIFIADGHHRYETAVNYANEAQDGSSKYTLAYFCKLDDNSLTILPTHRLIKDIGRLNRPSIIERLKKFFAIEEYPSAGECILALKGLKDHHAFGMYMGGNKFYCIRLKREGVAQALMGKGSRDWKGLDVAVLHLFIIQKVLAIRDEDDNIEFEKDARESLKLVDKGRFKIAFLLNPTKVSEVKKVAEHGEKMPRKATYFYPKLLSGLVINKF